MSAIKAIGEDRFGGYGVVFGTSSQKDTQGEYFTSGTNYALNWYEKRPALYHHGLDNKLEVDPIGIIDTIKADDIGLWIEGQWNKANAYIEAVKSLARAGKLGWSSGTLRHLKRVDPDGKITRWPIAEISMTPTPAEPRATGVSMKHISDEEMVTAAFKSIGITPDFKALQEADASTAQDGGGERDDVPVTPDTKAQKETKMDVNTQNQTVTLTTDALESLIANAAEKAATKALASAQPAKPPTPEAQAFANSPDTLGNFIKAGQVAPQPGQQKITVTRGTKWGNLTADQQSFAAEVLMGVSGGAWKPSAEFAREVADKKTKEVARGTDFKSALDVIPEDLGGFLKANEIVNTGQASYGTEWVADSWRANLWPKARQDNPVLSQLTAIDMPTDPYEFPFESTDPTAYHVAETSGEASQAATSAGPIPISKPGTGKVQASTEKIGLRYSVSGEETEDSIIATAPIFEQQARRVLLNTMDYVALSGDTVLTANTNLNKYDGTPGGTETYTTFNGILKYAIITNTAQTIAGGGNAPTLAKLRQMRFALDSSMYYNLGDLVCFVDNSTYAKLLDMPEFLTYDKLGGPGTAQTGLINTIDGIRYFPSAELGLAYTTGKVSATGSNNTTGRAVMIYKPNWMIGYRRHVKAVMEYLSYSDTWQMTMTLRMTMVTNGNSTKSAAALVNIGV
jgi:phage head maturation protease